MTWFDKIKPTPGAVYIKGNALPESDHETATGRALYTITAIRKAYDAGFAAACSSTGFGVCVDGVDGVDGVHVPDWKDQYEKQKHRAEMWIAKYEKDIGPLDKVYPAEALTTTQR